MTLASFLALLVTWCTAILSPGPDIVQITRLGSRSRRAGVWCAVGIMTGNAIWIIASLAGLAALMQAYPAILGWLQLLGGSYLGWLGFKALRAGIKGWGGSSSSLSPAGPTGPAEPEISAAQAWRSGLATNMANPKAIVFFGAVFSQFIRPDMGAHWTLIVAVALIVVGLAWFVGFALAVRALSAKIARNGALIDVITGAIFLLLAVYMMVEGVRAVVWG
ncbi:MULTISPECIES: LysE family translocator [unclassified Corynebacterium]|uniref:LysE family translocator n=1 Tax=unclassified Corynebacterium TaxID=2624378 RepID=UPI0029CA77B6|nr:MULTISPECIES: LysE family translocator [unclassified Corynebacterium]WPF66223.1 LysE family translocator [Corynebacterium sp. 22KM0430]WPF68713.1 LysE family translocator [Corynebacterium sp. 21KM1197]